MNPVSNTEPPEHPDRPIHGPAYKLTWKQELTRRNIERLYKKKCEEFKARGDEFGHKKLGEAVGVSRSTISGPMKGHQAFSQNVVINCAEFFGVRVSDLDPDLAQESRVALTSSAGTKLPSAHWDARSIRSVLAAKPAANFIELEAIIPVTDDAFALPPVSNDDPDPFDNETRFPSRCIVVATPSLGPAKEFIGVIEFNGEVKVRNVTNNHITVNGKRIRVTKRSLLARVLCGVPA